MFSLTHETICSQKEAHRVMAKMQFAADVLISLKNYSNANQMLTDMLYVINMLEKQFSQSVDDKKMYHIYSNKAICLYYLVYVKFYFLHNTDFIFNQFKLNLKSCLFSSKPRCITILRCQEKYKEATDCCNRGLL